MLGEIKCQQNATLTQQAWDVDCSEREKDTEQDYVSSLGCCLVQGHTTGLYVKLGMLTVVQEYRDKQQDYM